MAEALMERARSHLQQYSAHINSALERQLELLQDGRPELWPAMRYAVVNGGKRIRAALVSAAAAAVAPGAVAPEALDCIASVVEFMHGYSLAHDDLPAMDDDDMRRDQPACHIRFDEATAILAGDALQAHAFGLLSRCPSLSAARRLQMLDALVEAVGLTGMVGGQARDLALVHQQHGIAELEQMQRMKTAALIAASLRLGGLAAAASAAQLQILARFGADIGLAFQICDDLLDSPGSSSGAQEPNYCALVGAASARRRMLDLERSAVAALDGGFEGQQPVARLGSLHGQPHGMKGSDATPPATVAGGASDGDLPRECPATPLLDRIDSPADLRALDASQLPTLASELRAFLLYTVARTGGHFGASLGVVELSVALHYLYDTPEDLLLWDVGHQAYPHKILTGRRERMATLRQRGGLSGFLKRDESPYDHFGAGHSSTSISAALGMALAARQQGSRRRVAAVIGDGAITAGMAYEAMAHLGETRADALIVLNDNQMSISHNIGGLHNYLARIWSSKTYSSLRTGGRKALRRMPTAWELAKRTEEHIKGMVSPCTLFEALELNYIGPVDGHDLPLLLRMIGNLRDLEGPQLLHVLTVKGKGYAPAEADPVRYHAISKWPVPSAVSAAPQPPRYQQIFGDWLCEVAARDARLAAITPAMCEGSGMTDFAARFPERFHDVAIAEQHSVTLAAGMACGGLKPVVAIYSTFLQRAYDQLIHDVALQNLDVTFAIDRAGLVGEDGPTHAGSFDLCYLRCVPNMVVLAPSDGDEARCMLETAYQYEGPAAVRYPRGAPPVPLRLDVPELLPIGRGLVRRRGHRTAFLVFGAPLAAAMEAAEAIDASVVDMRFVKPLDAELLRECAASHQLLVTVEEGSLAGGAGAAVGELLAADPAAPPLLRLGLPDHFVEHGTRNELLALCGLDAAGIGRAVERWWSDREGSG